MGLRRLCKARNIYGQQAQTGTAYITMRRSRLTRAKAQDICQRHALKGTRYIHGLGGSGDTLQSTGLCRPTCSERVPIYHRWGRPTRLQRPGYTDDMLLRYRIYHMGWGRQTRCKPRIYDREHSSEGYWIYHLGRCSADTCKGNRIYAGRHAFESMDNITWDTCSADMAAKDRSMPADIFEGYGIYHLDRWRSHARQKVQDYACRHSWKGTE